MTIDRAVATTLGYEQGLLISQLAKQIGPVELSAACKAAGCSWDESYMLADVNVIEIKADETEKRVYVTITSFGRGVAKAFDDRMKQTE